MISFHIFSLRVAIVINYSLIIVIKGTLNLNYINIKNKLLKKRRRKKNLILIATLFDMSVNMYI